MRLRGRNGRTIRGVTGGGGLIPVLRSSFTFTNCPDVAESVSFTDTSTPAADILTWSWTFGDGGVSALPNPSHAYAAAGNYTVTLTVSNGTATSVSSQVVYVMTVVAGVAPNPVGVGVDATFTPTVVGGTAPYLYQWQFEQDTLWDDLVGYWELFELTGTRRDSRGWAHLADLGGVGAAPGGGASFDKALSQWLLATPQVDIDCQYGLTVAFWVNVRPGAPVGNNYFSNGSVFISNFGFSDQNATPLTMGWGIINDAGLGSYVGTVLAAYDTWYLVVGTYDPATKKVSLSIDAGAPSVALTGIAGDHPFVNYGYGAGRVQVGGTDRHSFYSTCYMRRVGMWNRVLSGAEITTYLTGISYPGSTEEIPVYAYPTDGAKVASITVTSSTGCTATDTQNVTVNP